MTAAKETSDWLAQLFSPDFRSHNLSQFPTITLGELKKILKQITDDKSTGKDKEQASEYLQEQITLVQFANDECDYGMGLELALDLFCFGSERFHTAILQLLPLAYKLLGRDLFAEIAEIHVNNRSRAQLSQLPS